MDPPHSVDSDADERFMRLCEAIAEQSKDTATKVGACIVDKKGKILGFGYNNMPKGCENEEHLWEKDRESDPMKDKLLYVCHAELNAIVSAKGSLEGTTLYCTLHPCNDCARLIIQKGINRVVYSDDKHKGKVWTEAAKKMFHEVKKFRPTFTCSKFPPTAEEDTDAFEVPVGETSPREPELEGADFFMAYCKFISCRSKDPNTQVGTCVVDSKNNLIGSGYNDMPKDCSDLPWSRDSSHRLGQKYEYVCHGVLNAIVNTTGTMEGGTVYTTLFPCNTCAKLIIQNGIKNVIFTNDKYPYKPETKAAKKLFDIAGVSYREFVFKNKEIKICL